MRILIALLLAAGLSPAATYFVANAGLDTNNGTSTSTPWQTIAHVNAHSFSVGDSILFNRGDMWREQLKLISSGNSSNPIVIGTYGSGAKPIINGSDLVSGTWTANYSQTNLFTDTMNHNGSNGVWTVTGTGVSFASSQLQVVMAGVSGSHRVSYVYTASPPTDEWVSYQVFFPSGYSIPNGTEGMNSGLYDSASGNGRGSVGYHSTSGVIFWKGFYNGGDTGTSSQAITTNVTHTVLIHEVFGAGTGSFTYAVDGVTLGTASGLTNNASLANEIVLGENFVPATVTESAYYSNVQVYTATGVQNVWQTSVTTQPNIVIFGGNTVGTYSSTIPIAGDLTWSWASNVLSVYSVTNPSTRFGTIEAGSRNAAIDIGGDSYLTFDGLSLQKSNNSITGGLVIAGGGTGAAHIIFKNGESAYNAGAGVSVQNSAGAANLISYNSLHDNSWGVETYQYNGASAGSETVIDHNTIYNTNYISALNTFPEAIHLYGNYLIAQYNTLYSNGNVLGDSLGMHIYNGHGEVYGQHNILRFNSVTGQVSDTLDGSGFEEENASNNDIYGNTFYGNYGLCMDVLESSATRLLNNTCYGNRLNAGYAGSNKAEISLTGATYSSTTNITVENNAVYATQPSTYAIWVDSATAGNALTISNNVLYDSGQANWYDWGGTAGSILATWNALSGVGTDVNSDPKYSNPGSALFTLQPSSPARNAGLIISGIGQQVAELVPDIGAYEYAPGKLGTLSTSQLGNRYKAVTR